MSTPIHPGCRVTITAGAFATMWGTVLSIAEAADRGLQPPEPRVQSGRAFYVAVPIFGREVVVMLPVEDVKLGRVLRRTDQDA